MSRTAVAVLAILGAALGAGCTSRSPGTSAMHDSSKATGVMEPGETWTVPVNTLSSEDLAALFPASR